MYTSIPYIIALCVLIWFSQALTKIFQREVDPMRRRDLTLANAEGAEAVEARFSFGGRFGFRVVIAILIFLICFIVRGVSTTADGGRLPSIFYNSVFSGILLLGMIPMRHGTITMFSARACRMNRPLSALVVLAGFLAPVAAVALFPVVVFALVANIETRSFDGTFGRVFFYGVQGLIAISAMVPFFMACVLPIVAVKSFSKAYPYSE